MEKNVNARRSPKPDFSKKEIEVAHILVELPSLICQSNLTRHIKLWGGKAKRSAENTSISASAPPLVKIGVPSEFMRKSREEFEKFKAVTTLKLFKYPPARNPKPEELSLMKQESEEDCERLLVQTINKLKKQIDKRLENTRVLRQELEKVKLYNLQLKEKNLELKARIVLYKNNGRNDHTRRPGPDQEEPKLLHRPLLNADMMM